LITYPVTQTASVSGWEDIMLRKLSMVTAVALIALTSSISIGKAEAHPWGWHGGWGYHYWGPRYYGYGYVPYLGPRCYVSVYGNTVCY
ncbi:MAG: hypothetical protein WBX30_16740, partial [Stellaceae bacterium]